MLRSSPAVTAALLALGIAGPASATIMVPLSLEELATESTAIVRARVLDRSAAWDDERKRIYTTSVLEVVESVYSATPLGREIRVRTLGGEVGEVGMKVAGTPDFKLGEEVLLFLRPDAKVPTSFAVIGMNQGRFAMRTDSAGRLIATPTWDGIAFARPGNDGVLRVGGHETPTEKPYLELRTQVLALRAKAAALAAPAAPVAPAVPSAPQAPATPATPLAPAGK